MPKSKQRKRSTKRSGTTRVVVPRAMPGYRPTTRAECLRQMVLNGPAPGDIFRRLRIEQIDPPAPRIRRQKQ